MSIPQTVKGYPARVQPIGQVTALFPSYDPECYLRENFLDWNALNQIQIEDTVMARDWALSWPPHTGLEFATWLRDNEVTIVTQTLIRKGGRRYGRWYGRYRLILGMALKGGM